MRIFKTKTFSSFARKSGFSDSALRDAVARAERFAKNERENIRDNELVAIKILAQELFARDDVELAEAVRAKFLIEVTEDNA